MSMVVNGSGVNLYGIIGQPLTPDYLAKQLPLFEQRVPTGSQGRHNFPTNAPPNLPIPSLYPAEEVQLQENRVICTDTFSEPAVGALYVTNYRIIFCGNLISDPESLEDLQNASYSGRSRDFSTLGGEYASAISSKLKDKFSRKVEPNFQSFLFNDQPDSEQEKGEKDKSSRERFKSSIRRTIGSLRRSPRTRLKTTTLPPPSHPPPILDSSLTISPTDETKHRGTYIDSETASQDSSSLSEFSSIAGTDDRSIQSPLREFTDVSSPPIDINGTTHGEVSPPLVPDSGYKGDSSLDATLSSYKLLHSGINQIERKENPSEVNDVGPVVLVNEESLCTHKTASDVRRKFQKAKSVESSSRLQKASLQRAATVDSPQNQLLTPSRRGSRKFWENSIVLIESDSDSDDSLDLHSSAKPLTVTTHFSFNDKQGDPVYTDYSNMETFDAQSPSSLVIPEQFHAHIEEQETLKRNDEAIYSEPQINTSDHHETPTESPHVSNTRPYANMEIVRLGNSATVVSDQSRSQSSSPKTARKPKPLPRLQTLKGDRDGLVASLPADFKQVSPVISDYDTKEDTTNAVASPSPDEYTATSSDTTLSSPDHTANTPLSTENSLQEPVKNEGRDSPTPIPPPRRKRTTKRLKSESQRLTLSMGKIPSTTSKLQSEKNKLHDGVLELHDKPADDAHASSTIHEESKTLINLEDRFSEDLFAKTIDLGSRTSLGMSRVSLAVQAASRPHSIVTPTDYQGASNFSFGEPVERGSLAYSSMPRVLATTWSPRSVLKKKAIVAASTRYTLTVAFPLYSIHTVTKLQPVTLKEQGIKLPEGLLILSRTAHSLKLHIHPHNTYDAEGMRELLERKFLLPKPLHEVFAFQYYAAIHHPNPTFVGNRSLPSFFKLTGEMNRLGLIGSKLWRVARILTDHPDLCPSYPPHLIMPICTPDMDILRGASLYKEGRFPTLTWLHPSGTALLRAATTKEERGQGSNNLQMDEALLKAICACNSSSKGPATLFVFTEKGVTDSKYTSLKPEEVRSYYYHNCKFVYSEAPPTYKSVRHSFNKLQALLESKLPEEEYLLALDSTKWLQRVGELLSVSNTVVAALTQERAHVLVCFESGWDRTTQVVSLAQLLMDPFYRTMNGFQVLIQKEWVWFGHPFRSRHAHHGKTKTKVKSDGPLFLQWIDCVWQVMNQCPSAFEFNDKFLMSLVEESYSGKFGTFMTDCERMRKETFTERGHDHMCVSTHTVSYWTWVAMVNSVDRTFHNNLYDPSLYPSVIIPSPSLPQLKLWTAYYYKYKNQEIVFQRSILERHLEDLLSTYKKLEALRANLEPRDFSLHDEENVPPPIMPRDEIFERSVKDHYATPNVRSKPTPPPKPDFSKPYFNSIEQYLLKEGLDPSLCKHIELGPTTCQGNLVKIGGVRKNWLQRWFVLDFDCQYLAYFENKAAYENREVPKGVIRLSDIIKVYQNMKKKDHLMRNIVTIETSQRTYLVQAPTIPTMYIWQTCLTIPTDSFGPRTN